MARTPLSNRPELLDDAVIAARLPAPFVKPVVDLAQRWHALAQDGAPPRDSIDPLRMPGLLPVLAILEYLPTVDDWRYELVGEEVRQMIGGKVKGRLLGEVLGDGDDARRVRGLYDATVQIGRPTITYGRHTVGYRTDRDFARILFPHRDKSGALTTLLLVLVYL